MSKNKLASSNISININKLAQIVVKELKKDNYIFNVLNIYEWPPKGKKLDGNETLMFKRKMCGRFASIIDKENKNQIEIDGKKVEWTKAVLKWGGILGNNQETILKYATQSAESLCSLSEGVASWSKVLAFQRPDKYFIYDYHVAFVLNYILISHDETISQYFFIPLSKRLNSKSNLDSKYAYCNLIARLLGKINDGVSLGVFELSLQESYRLYLDLIEQIVEVLNDETDNCFHLVGDDKQKVEMALFMKFNEYEEKVKAWRLTDD